MTPQKTIAHAIFGVRVALAPVTNFVTEVNDELHALVTSQLMAEAKQLGVPQAEINRAVQYDTMPDLIKRWRRIQRNVTAASQPFEFRTL